MTLLQLVQENEFKFIGIRIQSHDTLRKVITKNLSKFNSLNFFEEIFLLMRQLFTNKSVNVIAPCE
jgi:hypothetical protein